jgi:hypothetical protein
MGLKPSQNLLNTSIINLDSRGPCGVRVLQGSAL